MNKKINIENLKSLINGFLASGKKVVAPIIEKGIVVFKPIQDSNQISFSYIQTVLSPKGVFFPSTEEILKFEFVKEKTKIIETIIPDSEVVLFGVKPCDAYGLQYLTEFFLKENTDTYFKFRKDRTTIIGLSCKDSDSYCFCTSVGITPSDSNGSDLFLTLTENDYYAEAVSEKGKLILDENVELFDDSEPIDKSKYTANPEIKFDVKKIVAGISGQYDNEKWSENAFSCYGCGACAFSCPTCSCYDLQDESNPYGGRRLKNWDTCGLSLFTIHASGHNPKHIQSQRWKHRIFHKFDYSVRNMNRVSCVGCGRCIRVCPGSMDIVETLKSFMD